MPPALRALLLTTAAAALVGLLATQVALAGWVIAAAVGALAAAGARLLRMDRWWPPLLLVLPAGVWLGQRLSVPAGAWAAGALLLLAAYGGVYRTQVPLFLSRRTVWESVLRLLPAPSGGARYRFVDLGSGFGGLPRFLGRHRGDVDCLGVELAPLPALLAWVRSRVMPLSNVRLERTDLWQVPLGQIDLAFAFLSPVPMAALWQKARTEMRAGSALVSCEFEIPDVSPSQVIETGSRRLFLYRIN